MPPRRCADPWRAPCPPSLQAGRSVHKQVIEERTACEGGRGGQNAQRAGCGVEHAPMLVIAASSKCPALWRRACSRRFSSSTAIATVAPWKPAAPLLLAPQDALGALAHHLLLVGLARAYLHKSLRRVRPRAEVQHNATAALGRLHLYRQADRVQGRQLSDKVPCCLSPMSAGATHAGSHNACGTTLYVVV
eukprot:scaffold2482_cov407-Prasinococcus_capsulatus_cf.AAC.5